MKDVAGTPMALLRLPQVLQLIPISKSSWWAGIKKGRYPAGTKIGPKTTVWRQSDIEALIASLSSETASAK